MHRPAQVDPGAGVAHEPIRFAQVEIEAGRPRGALPRHAQVVHGVAGLAGVEVHAAQPVGCVHRVRPAIEGATVVAGAGFPDVPTRIHPHALALPHRELRHAGVRHRVPGIDGQRPCRCLAGGAGVLQRLGERRPSVRVVLVLGRHVAQAPHGEAGIALGRGHTQRVGGFELGEAAPREAPSGARLDGEPPCRRRAAGGVAAHLPLQRLGVHPQRPFQCRERRRAGVHEREQPRQPFLVGRQAGAVAELQHVDEEPRLGVEPRHVVAPPIQAPPLADELRHGELAHIEFAENGERRGANGDRSS